MAWEHDFRILFLFHQFLISLDLVYVFKYVNPILLTYTVLAKLGECDYYILFTHILVAVLTQQQEKQLVYVSCLVVFIVFFFQNLIAYSLFLVLIVSLLLFVTETLSFSLLSHSLLCVFPP